MLIEHLGHSPRIDSSAYVAPDATICGNVSIGPGCRIMHGARIIAEGGRTVLKKNCIIMQNAVVRSTDAFDCILGGKILVGPTSHVIGSTVEEASFLATGSSIFHGSTIGRGCVVRVHGVVHANSALAEGTTVPIGGVAVGNPACVFTTDQADAIWEIQEKLAFTTAAYGINGPLKENVEAVTEAMSARLSQHMFDKVLPAQTSSGP